MRHLTYRPASNFKRAVAYMIDVIPIQVALYLVSQIYFGISPVPDALAGSDAITTSRNAGILITASTLGIWIIYCVLGEISPWQGTFGKMTMGLCVRSTTGRRLTFRQSLGRNAAKILSALPFYLGFLAAFVVYGNRAWHDSLSGTAVVDRR